MQNRDLRIGIHLLVQIFLVAVCQKCGELIQERSLGWAWHRPILICAFSFSPLSNVSVRLSYSSHGIYIIAPFQLLKIELQYPTIGFDGKSKVVRAKCHCQSPPSRALRKRMARVL